MKEVKIKKGLFKTIGIIITSVILILLFIWFGISFYLMRSEVPYVSMFIDLRGNTLANKVKNDFPIRDSKFLKYIFPVTLEQFTETKDTVDITGVPLNYKNYYGNRDEARFEYSLEKTKGSYDFSKIESNDTILVTLQYRLDKDVRYFLEFSTCVLKRGYYNLFNINNECSRGNCYVERDLNMWFVEEEKQDIATKRSFYQSFDHDKLIRSLTNFFITDEFGYFKVNDGYKAYSVQVANPDRTYQYEGIRIDDDNLSNELVELTPWVLNGVSRLYDKKYEEYDEIDLLGYLQKIISYLQNGTYNSFNSCQVSYDVISNLDTCESNICDEIKTSVYEYCKKEIEKQLDSYKVDYQYYFGYHYGENIGTKNAYLIFMPSELIYYNKIVGKLSINSEKFDKNTIVSYQQKAEKLISSDPELIEKCYLVKGFEDINSEYSDLDYGTKIASIVSTFPDFNNVCDGVVKDKYCSLSISEKLVCADALLSNNSNTSQLIMQDIFYKHYFTSPGASKMASYEGYRIGMAPSTSDGVRLDDYGYFVHRAESLTDKGEVVVRTTANLSDSYYFIYLLEKLSYEN